MPNTIPIIAPVEGPQSGIFGITSWETLVSGIVHGVVNDLVTIKK